MKKLLWLLLAVFTGAIFLTGCEKPENSSNKNEKLRSSTDLNGKRIGVLVGSVHDTFAGKTYPKAEVLQFKSLADIVLALKAGKIDAALYDMDSVHEILRSIIGFPFTIIKDNNPIGFDIELSKRFAAHLGKELILANMEFGNLIAAVSTNKIDMIASSLVITEERKKQIIFSDTYYEMGTSVFALNKNIAANGSATVRKDNFPFFTKIVRSFESNIILEKRYLLILSGLKTTVIISVLATILGTLLGGLVCYMRMSHKLVLNLPAKMYISIMRGTPVLVFLMLIFYVVFASVNIDPVIVSVIAFGMNFAAYVAEIYRTGIEGVDKGQTEAGIAMGFTKVKTLFFIVLPQTVRRILPIYKGEFISMVKATSIVGYIAVQDLTKASDIIRSRTFDAFFPLLMVATLYFLITWFLMQSMDYLELIIDPKFKKRKVHGT
ncbi:MAG: ABC transporter substrate-binding protein/permease [Lentisphaerota bacterium]